MSDWVAGRRGISAAKLLRVCEVSGASAEFLRCERGPVYSNDILPRSTSTNAFAEFVQRCRVEIADRTAQNMRKDGITAADTAVDVEVVFNEIAQRASEHLRDNLARYQSGRRHLDHVSTLQVALKHFSGMQPASVAADGTNLHLPLRSDEWLGKYREIVDEIYRQSVDLDELLHGPWTYPFDGITLSPYFARVLHAGISASMRSFAAEQHPEPEMRALRQLELDRLPPSRVRLSLKQAPRRVSKAVSPTIPPTRKKKPRDK